MKKSHSKLAFILIVSLIPLSIAAQNKKYALLEHFTNTYSSDCFANNPEFYKTIDVENNKNLHHISFHTNIPSKDCPFYQPNTTEQDVRKDFYSISSNPRVSINGNTTITVDNVAASTLSDLYKETSPVSIKVNETTGNNRTVTIEVKKSVTFDDATTYRIFAAIVERKINYSANNGEKVHYNVFRKWVKAIPDAYLPQGNATQTYTYTYNIDPNWFSSEIYVLAFLQDVSSRIVINSGTRFDGLSPVNEALVNDKVIVSPNPTNGHVNLLFEKVKPINITILNSTGQVVQSMNADDQNSIEVNLSEKPAGVYFLKIKTTEGVAVKKIMKN